ncbi:DUF58 domain-containing protein [Pseudanabaena sp. FACHB-1998]|uniref:DUF58 domain-containing protein n=1 Tax=Pseudanabaena sp. FACHB-1998 TaxID=2692858 RepID=UPI001680A621|nr:DUF58 domain-containing protein [Pseudanabaena sp. FACHB-1998]MBD2177352.1 DUF58 domain-containing protein [Pseudanabaena sp. FACHB-1998]
MANITGDRQKSIKRQKKPSKIKRFFRWLERRFATPEFIGGMYGFLSLFFFMAATNTLSGWLYVISGVSFALLIVGAVMPKRLLAEIVVVRSQVDPVSVGDDLWVDLIIQNTGKTEKRLLEVRDILPENFSYIPKQDEIITSQRQHPDEDKKLPQKTIEVIAPYQQYRWAYEAKTHKRGVFDFRSTEIATSSPLGLFRSRRACPSGQKIIVYPTVLPLDRCPLVDQLGKDTSPRQYSDEHNYNNATEGLTKTLRPYRWGDPTRLIHWRTSAKFGELRVRELEVTIGGQEVAIALDTSAGWQPEAFEEAVVAAASLYFYAQKSKLSVRLWTTDTGIVQSDRTVLETLAAAKIANDSIVPNILKELPDLPVVWLSHRSDSIAYLPFGSRWILWQAATKVNIPNQRSLGLTIETISDNEDGSYKSLRSQLQEYLSL